MTNFPLLPDAPIVHPLPDTPSFNARLQELFYHYGLWCAKRYHEDKERESHAEIMDRAALPAVSD